ALAGAGPATARRGGSIYDRDGSPPSRGVAMLPQRQQARRDGKPANLCSGSGRAGGQSLPPPPPHAGGPRGKTDVKPCISEATTLPCTFAEDVAAYADASCPAMEVWLTKLETHLENHSAADTRKLLEDRQLTLAAAAYQGGLLLSQGEQRKA